MNFCGLFVDFSKLRHVYLISFFCQKAPNHLFQRHFSCSVVLLVSRNAKRFLFSAIICCLKKGLGDYFNFRAQMHRISFADVLVLMNKMKKTTTSDNNLWRIARFSPSFKIFPQLYSACAFFFLTNPRSNSIIYACNNL